MNVTFVGIKMYINKDPDLELLHPIRNKYVLSKNILTSNGVSYLSILSNIFVLSRNFSNGCIGMFVFFRLERTKNLKI